MDTGGNDTEWTWVEAAWVEAAFDKAKLLDADHQTSMYRFQKRAVQARSRTRSTGTMCSERAYGHVHDACSMRVRDARCVHLSRQRSAGKCGSLDRNKITRLLCHFNTEPIDWIGFISSRDSWTSASVRGVCHFWLCLQVGAGYDYTGPIVVHMLKPQSLLLGQLFFMLPSCDMDGTLL